MLPHIGSDVMRLIENQRTYARRDGARRSTDSLLQVRCLHRCAVIKIFADQAVAVYSPQSISSQPRPYCIYPLYKPSRWEADVAEWDLDIVAKVVDFLRSTYIPSTWLATWVWAPCLMVFSMSLWHDSEVITIAPIPVKIAILLVAPVWWFACKRWHNNYISSFIPGTITVGSLSEPRRPWTVGFMGSQKAPWMVTSDACEMSVIFHCWPTPLIPAPESKICR